jgi:hypothetical protein
VWVVGVPSLAHIQFTILTITNVLVHTVEKRVVCRGLV